MEKPLNLIDKAFLLKKTALFGALDLDMLLTISDKMELINYEPTSLIFQAEQNPTRLYFIIEGKVQIQDQSGNMIAEVSSGDFFGDEAIFGSRPRAYTAIAQSKTSILALTSAHLLSIIEECPAVALAFLQAYSSNTDFRIR